MSPVSPNSAPSNERKGSTKVKRKKKIQKPKKLQTIDQPPSFTPEKTSTPQPVQGYDLPSIINGDNCTKPEDQCEWTGASENLMDQPNQ